MRRSVRMLFLVALAWGGLAAPVQAQYGYDDTPRPYYDDEQEPWRGYREPPWEYRAFPPQVERDLGQRCRVRLSTDIGRTRYVCPIVRARVIGRPCVCPPPRGYGPGPYLDGIVID